MYEIFFLKKYIFKRKYLVNFEKGEGPGRGPEPALVETSTECRLMSYVEQCTG